ncbi:MAG TPA: 50S ribosomal protein L31 [Thermomicrobiaceae bacterium]|nr:50S ribosomal protein L31 [Thermomicrobiaceae bacterium]
MKQGIHPKYVEAQVVCACGNSWTTRSTKPLLRIDLCPQCHPFYTGEQRIVDSAGQVERFMKRMEAAQEQPRRKKVERRQKRLEQLARVQRTQEQLVVEGADETEGQAKPAE